MDETRDSKVKGAWRLGYFGRPGSTTIWRGWVNEASLSHVVVFEQPQATEIMAHAYGRTAGVSWSFDADEGAFYAWRDDEVAWQEIWYSMNIEGPAGTIIKVWPIGYTLWQWEERAIDDGHVRTLAIPDPRFQVTFLRNAVLAVDSDGELAYSRVANGPTWTHRGWTHLQYWFDALPWTSEEMPKAQEKKDVRNG